MGDYLGEVGGAGAELLFDVGGVEVETTVPDFSVVHGEEHGVALGVRVYG